MQYKDGTLIYSPSDISRFSRSQFASYMERAVAENPNRNSLADAPDELMELLSEQGIKLEKKVFELLKENKTFISIGGNNTFNDTVDAMVTGTDVIYQAHIKAGQFEGFPDFLIKTEGNSRFGNYQYEVWDVKLSKDVKPQFTLQLCCYVEILSEVQGQLPASFGLFLGNEKTKTFQTQDYFYYYQKVKADFLKQQNEFSISETPIPFDSKEYGRWSSFANNLLEEKDHLIQVATITRTQIKKLESAGILTMTELANADVSNVTKLPKDKLIRLKRQAQLQIESKDCKIPKFDVLPHIKEPKTPAGLQIVAPHSDNDVFFDIEGYPLENGGLEYLWGSSYFDETGKRCFKDFWAHNEEQEKLAFQQFIAWVYGRWKNDPTMHIYHYANYEIAACQKLSIRYGVCEYELDALLRHNVFIDLYKAVKESLILGEPRYSIKNVEHLYREQRSTDVGNGGDSVVYYDKWRQQPDGETWESSKILKDLRAYNIDDCDSTQELVEWLRNLKEQNNIEFIPYRIPDQPTEQETPTTRLRDKLLSFADSIKDDSEKHQLIKNLAHSLEFHSRELKPVYWKQYERLSSFEEDLYDDLDCIIGCTRNDVAPYRKKENSASKNLVHQYTFDNTQPFRNKLTNRYYAAGQYNDKGYHVSASVHKNSTDIASGVIALEHEPNWPNTINLIPDEIVRNDSIGNAALEVIENLNLTNGKLSQCALIDFLLRRVPNTSNHNTNTPIITSKDTNGRLKEIIQTVANLNNSYLPIQGPPGTGKTFTGKHIIGELLKSGKRIGISSNSHKAINNLLVGAASHCAELGIEASFFCNKDTDEEIEKLKIEVISNPKISTKLEGLSGSYVVGSTAWGFASKGFADQFDYLFIDEAGQVSVANLIAMSRSTKNIILLGDQMQLGQPSQGTHPEESGLSILDYLFKNEPTVAENKGVFLNTTYRMHQDVNEFISQYIYDGKLLSAEQTKKQIIKVPEQHFGVIQKSSGIDYIEVDHEGNSQASEEEVSKILDIVNELIGREFTDKSGESRPITLNDILFVTPYNQQVNMLANALPREANVGSVDKFQGQEAPIVIVSMCASVASDSPRGLDFLLERNRINVAISRAKSLAIVVASTNLLSGTTSNLAQQRLVNLFCKLRNYKNKQSGSMI